MKIPAMNPIMKKELRVGARTKRYLIALVLYTGFMTMLASTIMSSADIMYAYNYNYGIDFGYTNYSSYTGSISWLAFAQMGMVCLIMPILTAGSISAEREKQTLDIMLTTPVSPFAITFGKLGSSMIKLFMFLLCSLPAMSICFLYGGIQWYTLITIYVGIMVIAFLIGAIGIWSSSVFQKTVVSIIITLLIEGLLFTLPVMILIINILTTYNALFMSDATSTIVQAGYMPMILLLCPVFGFTDAILKATTGYSISQIVLVDGISSIYETAPGMQTIQKIWAPLTILTAIAIGILFLWLAARRIDRSRRRNSKLNKDHLGTVV